MSLEDFTVITGGKEQEAVGKRIQSTLAILLPLAPTFLASPAQPGVLGCLHIHVDAIASTCMCKPFGVVSLPEQLRISGHYGVKVTPLYGV